MDRSAQADKNKSENINALYLTQHITASFGNMMGKFNEILTLVSDQDSPDTGSSIPENWIIHVVDLSKRFEILSSMTAIVCMKFFGNRSHHHDHWALRNLNSLSKRENVLGSLAQTAQGNQHS